MKLIALVVLLCSFGHLAKTQKADSAFNIYQDNIEEIWRDKPKRGTSTTTIAALSLLNKYKTNVIASAGGFAKDLSKLYSAKKHIGFLVFSFRNDTLVRQFFEPGKLLEEKQIPIMKAELLGYNAKLNHALNLYELSKNRRPQKRGAEVSNNTDSKKINLDSCIRDLTNLLIPDSFTEEYKHLVVIPCLNIGSIPFQILKPYRDNSYLIDKCSITTAPNMIDFIALRSKLLGSFLESEAIYLDDLDNIEESEKLNKIKWTFERPLFISNPSYPNDDKYHFPNLPGAEKEIEDAITQVEVYDLLKGDSATKEAFRSKVGNADMVYFATHGISDANDPAKNNFLVLSGKDPYLTSREIMDLRKDRSYKAPEMVILSACQTGLGKTMEGGVMGSLSRSFLLSGSSFVLESLWSVDDEATAYLMGQFMAYIQKSSAYFPAEALRKAVLETKKKYENPIFWASFNLIGTDF